MRILATAPTRNAAAIVPSLTPQSILRNISDNALAISTNEVSKSMHQPGSTAKPRYYRAEFTTELGESDTIRICAPDETAAFQTAEEIISFCHG